MDKFQPSEITALYLDDEVAKTNKLQQFINLVVTFAVLKLKSPEEPELTQPSHRF
jgi:hypothetical protein